MNKPIFIFMCASLCLVSSLFAQGNWELLIPSPTSNQMVSLYFIDKLTGWSVGEYGTITKTTDGGNTWQICQIDILSDLSDVHFPTEQIGYVVGEDGLILKTIDGGETWTPQPISIVSNLHRVKFYNEQHGWIIGEKGLILHTTDGGITWQQQSSESRDDLFGIDILGQHKVIIVGDNNSILLTENDGADWELIEFIPPRPTEIFHYKDVYFTNDSTGWICGEIEEFSIQYGFILETMDGGKNWNNKNTTSINIEDSHFSNTLEPLQQIYFKDDLATGLCLLGEPGLPFSFVGSYLIYTHDSGSSWQGYIDGYNEGFVVEKSRFQFLTDSSVIATGFGGDVRFSEDSGKTWHFKNNYKRFWNDFIIGPDGSLHALFLKQNSRNGDTYTVRHYESQDNGNSWTEYIPTITFLDGSQKEVEWIDNFGQFAGSTDSRLYTCYFNRTDSQFYILYSDDMGKTYHEVRRGIQEAMDFLTPDTLISALLIPVEAEPGVYKSSLMYSYSFDGGVTIQNEMFDNIWNDITPHDFFNQKSINDMFFFNGRSGFMVGSDGNILRTNYTGQSWENIYSGVVESLWDIEFLNRSTGFIAGDFGRILKTEDGGLTWRKTNSGTQENVYSIAFLSANEGWAGTENGLRFTTDGGETWHGVPLRYQHGAIRHISFDHQGNGYAYAMPQFGSVSPQSLNRSGSYVFLLRMGNNSIDISDDNYATLLMPKEIVLQQNFPNPFNTTTQIQYHLPQSGFVLLKIFNLQGQLVRTLVNESKESGRHVITWDGCSDAGNAVSSGVYIYQLKSDSRVKHQKLLLLK